MSALDQDDPLERMLALSDAAPADDEWSGDVEVFVPERRPRITPGEYEAFLVAMKPFKAFKRDNLELGFNVFDKNGEILGRIPMFVHRPATKQQLGQNSNLARLFHVAGVYPKKGGKLKSAIARLRYQRFRVRVEDAKKDTKEQKLPSALTYSKIAQVLEHLL